MTTGLVLAVCVVLAGAESGVLAASSERIAAATGRAEGTVEATSGQATVRVRWTPPGGSERVDEIAVAGAPPAPGTRTEVAFHPTGPPDPLIPGSDVLVAADRALTTIALAAVVAALVLAVLAWQVLTRRRAFA